MQSNSFFQENQDSLKLYHKISTSMGVFLKPSDLYNPQKIIKQKGTKPYIEAIVWIKNNGNSLSVHDEIDLICNGQRDILEAIRIIKSGKNISQDDLIDNIGIKIIQNEILADISKLKLNGLSKQRRIYLIDLAMKCGNLPIVEHLTEIFISQGFEDDIKIPDKKNSEHAYRPVFWLASTVTRHSPEENYIAIEKYLCEKFNIPDVVTINNKQMTRKEYLLSVDKWKHQMNIKLFVRIDDDKWTSLRKLTRYRRHELLDEIEKFDHSRLRNT